MKLLQLCMVLWIGFHVVLSVPIILDTDIGSDYDDQMALTHLLSRPDLFDLRFIVVSTYNTTQRAQIAAKTLAAFHRFDIPLAIGTPTGTAPFMWEYPWAQNFSLINDFQSKGGVVKYKGVEALYDEIVSSNEPEYLYLEIAPAISLYQSLVYKLSSSPKAIGKKLTLFMMGGSIYRGWLNTTQITAEYNVAHDIPASQFVFNNISDTVQSGFHLAPLDCTNFMQFFGQTWKTFVSRGSSATTDKEDASRGTELILDSYRVWYENGGRNLPAMKPFNPEMGTSTMHDVLAAWMLGRSLEKKGLAPTVIQGMEVWVNGSGYTLHERGDKISGKLYGHVCVGFEDSKDPWVSVQKIGEEVLGSIAAWSEKIKSAQWIASQ